MQRIWFVLTATVAILGAAAFGGLSPADAQSKYTPVAIPGLAGDQSCVATGVNTSRQVVGRSWWPGPERGWYWADGVQRDLGNLGVPGCSAGAINNRGVVVGTVMGPNANKETGASYRHAFVCRNPAAEQPLLEDLNTPGWLAGPEPVWDGYPTHRGFMFKETGGVNDGNMVTGEGWLFTGEDPPRTVLLAYVANVDAGTFVLTDTPAQLGAINAAGLAVGGPYLYSPADGTSVQLQGMAATCDLTEDMKFAGYIYPVIWAHACYKPGLNAPVQDLGTLGGNYSFALSIRDVTVDQTSYGTTIVGSSTTTKSLNSPAEAAFRWQPGTGMMNLNKLLPKGTGYTLRGASKITSNGLIVGGASTKSGGCGYLLIPQ